MMASQGRHSHRAKGEDMVVYGLVDWVGLGCAIGLVIALRMLGVEVGELVTWV